MKKLSSLNKLLAISKGNETGIHQRTQHDASAEAPSWTNQKTGAVAGLGEDTGQGTCKYKSLEMGKSHQNLFEKSDLLDTHKSCYFTVYNSIKEWRSLKIMTEMEKA